MHFTALLAQAADTTYQYSSDTSTSTTNAVAGMAILGIAIAAGLIMYAIFAYLMGRIFKKAGVEPWKAWVPVYNSWVMLELGGQAGWWALLAFVPLIGIAAAVIQYIAMYRIGLRFGKEGWFVLLAVFLPIVWAAWLALDDSTWKTDGNLQSQSTSPETPTWTPPATS